MIMNIVVIGGGGREHAIVWKLKQSKRVKKLYCIPGNAGISEIAECVSIPATEVDKITEWVKERKTEIDLVMVAPDDPLALGLVDKLEAIGVRAFGPKANAAVIEASKAFSKDLMKKYNIPTAAYETFTDAKAAADYISNCKFPIVIKADGLALGKGVIICENAMQAYNAINAMLVGGAFGKAGNKIVIEEFLKGFEVSVLAFTDGKTVVPMASSQDYKRAFDGDVGLNTGGMGTYSPSEKYTDEMAAVAMKTIFQPTIDAMRAEGRCFKGVIYFGLMVDGDSIKVLEYNARFGDPETQVLLPRLKNDLVDVFEAVIDSKLDKVKIEWDNSACVCVIMASLGYPEKYEKGKEISIGELSDNVMLFHSGTAFDSSGKLVTNGGRVLGITAKAATIKEARQIAYENVSKIKFDGAHYRKDIASYCVDKT
ncbi:phosphoribosylamine--glycine ligase [Holotrichia oblita]|nr:phosphoribosylamine--glycine ligase [Holotrichia oblita]